MKKIALFALDLKNGGAQRASTHIGNRLIEKGYDVTILLMDITDPHYTFNGPIIGLEKDLLIHQGEVSLIRKLKIIRNYIKKYQAFKKIIKSNHYDVVISFLFVPNIINVLTRKKKGKTILSVRSYLRPRRQTFMQTKFIPFMIKHFYGKADQIIAVSEGIKNQLIKEYRINAIKTKAITNGYPMKEIIDKINQTVDINDISFDSFTFITVGRLADEKGHIYLLRVFKELLKDYPNTQLLICGQGKRYETLNQYIKDHDMNQKVRLLGFRKDVYQLLRNSDAFVFPSIYEGFPNALIEAMIAKLPVISTDALTGPRTILEGPHGPYGILLPVISHNNMKEPLNDHEIKLFNAMKQLINDNQLREKYSILGFKRAQDFDLSQIITEWEEVINESKK